MPVADVDGLTINYDVQGEGEPLLLIPYTVGRSRVLRVPAPGLHRALQLHRDRPSRHRRERQAAGPVLDRGPTPTRSPRFLGAIGVERAHVAGVSLGAGVGHAPGRPPSGPRALALAAQRAGTRSDAYLKTFVEQWRTLARSLPTVADVVIQGIFPWCFTPEMYVERPEFVDALVDFVRSRPAQPLDAFLAQTEAALAHDASACARRHRRSRR